MSRKTDTVEYFPHFANASSKMTITFLEKKYSYQGYAVWFKLLECLASTEGHYLKLNTNLHLQYVTSKLGVTYDILISMLQDLAEIDAIDRILWEKEKGIWSDNFVSNLSTVYANRHRQLPSKPIIGNNGVHPEITLPTANLQTTYRVPTNISRVEEVEEVKKSRVEEVEEVKKSRVEEVEEVTPIVKNTIKSFEEYQEELKLRFPELDFKIEMEKFNLYWKDGKRKLKNPKLALLNWMSKSKEFQQNKKKEMTGYEGLMQK
jgi:hypothetical protein